MTCSETCRARAGAQVAGIDSNRIADHAQAVDTLLWTFSDESFLRTRKTGMAMPPGNRC